MEDDPEDGNVEGTGGLGEFDRIMAAVLLLVERQCDVAMTGDQGASICAGLITHGVKDQSQGMMWSEEFVLCSSCIK
ncbi:hypothetical protein POX_c04130 [Penicillium oxalicum]|uniref:hypothetical protein n=1 Tax=Penicillium oxalicum TaxID=69781 RepID=UPI0020B6F508|nr:hypothetical protein POX_c04130 [Penicillium oxalicum]KAI2791273.1 hypothetical protein POX_c04130 [Penicillium oxalicum]